MTLAPETPSNSQLIVEKDRAKKEDNTVSFFKELKTIVPIEKIYYPGPGLDQSLNRVFTPSQITYIDKDKHFEAVMKGDFTKTEIPDGTFDAIFLQDIHHTKWVFENFLKALKDNGLVVASMYGCGFDPPALMQTNDYINHPMLEAFHALPDWEKYFRTYRKKKGAS